MWKYNSPIGPIYIKFIPSTRRYGMIYNGTCWEASSTPEQEADNIYMHVTGCDEWDELDGEVPDVPKSLNEWEKL